MKICILTPRFPFPECGGDLLRINYIARHLKKQGHRLILVSYTEKEPDINSAKELFDEIYTIRRSRWNSIVYSALFLLRGRPIQCGYYYSKGYLRLFKKVVEKETPDMYVAHLIRMTPFLDEAGVGERSIVEMTDALSKTYALTGNAKGSRLKRFMYSLEKHLIGRYELDVIKRFPKVVLVSPSDIDYLASLLPAGESRSLALHTNGVNLSTKINTAYDSGKICFVGNMVSLQNQDAAIYFAEEIFPKILEKRPDARFYIVGNHPPKNICNLDNGKNIFVTGFVDDLDGFISDSCLAVAPIRIAAGIQNKVLVAMSNSIPTVLTPLIATPIKQLKSGENCFIADDPSEFADRCLQLLDDATLRNSMGRNGYQMVKEHYSWDSLLSGYESF